MRTGKYQNSKPAKGMALALALVLLLGCSIGGTLAWLIDTTDPVTNTFSPADIEITLTETFNTDTDNDGVNDAWEQEMVPGVTYIKDPVVAVDGSKTDVDCYLFVRFTETNDPSTYLTYTSNLTADNDWEQVPNTTDVWYRIVKVTDSIKSWNLLKDNQITVKNTVTKDNMAAAVEAELTYEAYAIQYVGFENDVAGAWAAAYAQKTTGTN